MVDSKEGRSIRGVIKDQLEQRMDKQTQRHKIKRREVAEVMLMRKDSLYIIREPVA